MTCVEQLNNSMLKIGECCENPNIYFPLPFKFYENYRNLKSLVRHDVQTGNPNHRDYHTLSDLCDFKMTLKQTMICLLRPGFHYTANATTTTQKQSDYKVEQSSFTLIALFCIEIGRCRGRNWLNGN